MSDGLLAGLQALEAWMPGVGQHVKIEKRLFTRGIIEHLGASFILVPCELMIGECKKHFTLPEVMNWSMKRMSSKQGTSSFLVHKVGNAQQG
jgi:hypothetical protein